jgi:hypothetical protein
MDWPPAPAISCVFAVLLLGAAFFDRIRRAERRLQVASRLAATVALLGLAGLGLSAALSARRAALGAAHEAHAGEPDEHSHGEPEHGLGDSRRDLEAALGDEHDNVRARAVAELGALGDPATLPALIAALNDASDAVKENAAQALGRLGRPEAAPALEAALGRPDQDEWVTLREADALVRCGGKAGMNALLGLARDADAGLVRREAAQRAAAFVGRSAPPASDLAASARALDEVDVWWREHGAAARWEPVSGRFVAP